MRLPVAVLALASMILVPSVSAFAHGPGNGSEGNRPEHRPPAIAFELVSASASETGEGTITATIEKVSPRLTEEMGLEEGEEMTITYTSETTFIVDGVEVERDSFEVGEILFVVGEIAIDDMTIEADVIANKPAFSPLRRLFRVGEVVEIDTEANTILIQSLRSVQEGELQQYVLVSYDNETTFDKDRQAVSESGVSVGDKIHVRGDVNTESEAYFAEIDAEHVLLWTELEPKRPFFQQGHRQAE